MNKRIYALPSSLVNQMAAGEVIERPASVVKELLENAIDANSHHIDITIEAAGLQLIEISDDGVGVHPDDLPLTILNHATSKIRTLDDLFSIQSLGFRGEALASIAGVSRFSLLSRQSDSPEGYFLNSDTHASPQISPCARTPGTTVSVRNLFYNTPVRRQFLSSEKTEYLQIEQVVKRAALSRFDIGFQLKNKSATVFHLPSITLDTQNSESQIQARIKKILGAAFLAQSVFFDVTRDNMRLWGWIGLPSLMRSQNDQQYFYLNKRIIRDKLINHAIRAAYEDHLYPGRQPAFILHLDLPPEQVDVNVHPTKHEVRFREQRQIHDFICHQLKQQLHQQSQTPKISNHIQEAKADYQNQTPRKSISTSPIILTLHWLEYPYCFIKSDTQTFLCDYVRLYQFFCKQHFLSQIETSSVMTRPLLLPIRVTLPQSLIDPILKLKSSLESLGLAFDLLDNATLIIRAFPSALPYFDIHTWVSYFEKKPLIESLVQANIPPNTISSHDTQTILNNFENYIVQANTDISIEMKQCYKIMTPTDWEKLLKS